MDLRFDDLLGGTVVGFFAGIAFFFNGFRTLKRKHLIENTPTSKVRSLAMGQVEVSGAAAPWKETLAAPFTEHACLYYSYTIEEYRRSGKSSRWVTVDKENRGVPFLLRDETGAVLVDPAWADVDIPEDYQEVSGMGNDPSTKVQGFVRQKGISFEGFLGVNKKMRFTEYHIAPQDRVFILGTAADNPYVKEATAIEGIADVMIQKGPKGSCYYIADKSEKECLRSHAWGTAAQVYGGAALTVACLVYILAQMHLF
ncbi:MAG: hypothetical protein HYV03_01165 [Deltaproteobacteria bacterium]|nr:hypothetical protein [Deltaproteobacteria bacterium]